MFTITFLFLTTGKEWYHPDARFMYPQSFSDTLDRYHLQFHVQRKSSVKPLQG
jgi:hypothetical protein